MRNKLIIVAKSLPTGNLGYCLCNKEKTLRFTCYTMIKADLKNSKLFSEGVPLEKGTYVLV